MNRHYLEMASEFNCGISFVHFWKLASRQKAYRKDWATSSVRIFIKLQESRRIARYNSDELTQMTLKQTDTRPYCGQSGTHKGQKRVQSWTLLCRDGNELNHLSSNEVLAKIGTWYIFSPLKNIEGISPGCCWRRRRRRNSPCCANFQIAKNRRE